MCDTRRQGRHSTSPGARDLEFGSNWRSLFFSLRRFRHYSSDLFPSNLWPLRFLRPTLVYKRSHVVASLERVMSNQRERETVAGAARDS